MGKLKADKPILLFCWHCGKKLWGNYHKLLYIQEHGRILHKACAKQIEKENLYEYKK